MDMLLNLTREKTEQIRSEQLRIHKHKLAKIGIFDRVDSKYVNMRRRGMDKKESVELADPIFNLSARTLNDIEKHVLIKGLRYGIKAKRVDTFEILARFEVLAESMVKLPILTKVDRLRANLNSKTNFYRQLQGMADEYIQLSKKTYDNLNDEERESIIEHAQQGKEH